MAYGIKDEISVAIFNRSMTIDIDDEIFEEFTESQVLTINRLATSNDLDVGRFSNTHWKISGTRENLWSYLNDLAHQFKIKI